ncbi:MAG: OmpH family outer membrane protein [Chitinophagaceae bacterium]
MKKVFFTALSLVTLFIGVNTATAQQQPLKIGVFDIDLMVQAMPGYRAVDSMVQLYQRDSLGAEYDFYQSEYKRLDSTYKADSAQNKAKSVLTMEQQQKQQVAINLVYWQQISQQKTDAKTAQLAQPLYEQVVNAYKKVLDAKKYTLILKPTTIERGTTGVDNIFEAVAKELKVQLPPELGGGQDQQNTQQQQPAKPAPKSSTTKPPGK